jgi:hypothetical protein
VNLPRLCELPDTVCFWAQKGLWRRVARDSRLTRIRPPSDLRSGDTSVEDLLKRESQLLHKYDGETPIEKASSEIPTYRESEHRSNGKLIYQKSVPVVVIFMYLNDFMVFQSAI